MCFQCVSREISLDELVDVDSLLLSVVCVYIYIYGKFHSFAFLI